VLASLAITYIITGLFHTLNFLRFRMPKRTASDALLNGQADQPFNKMSATGIRRETHSIDEMGEFEDAWEDEMESDQEVDVDEEREDGGCASFTCEYNLHAIIAFRNGY
jgi:hypothetical protein